MSEEQEVCSEIVFPRNIRKTTHMKYQDHGHVKMI